MAPRFALLDSLHGPESQRAAFNFIPPFCCLALVVANHSLFRLGALSALWAVALVFVLAAVTVLSPTLELKARGIRRLQPLNVLIGVVILAPLLASLALGWNREFPFHGDHNFHIRQTIFLANWWLSPVGTPSMGTMPRALIEASFRNLISSPLHLLQSRAVCLVLVLAISGFCYRWYRLAALLLAAACLIGWGLFEQSSYYRYPGAWYLIALPFLGPAYFTHNLELAGRLANVAAPIVWLFALRPFLIGRWPDLPILPVAALVLWQQDVLYFFDSSYLEPWCVVLGLLAAESLMLNGSAAAPLACLLVGVAAALKEPPILALPFVWLAGKPWRGPWAERAKLVGFGLAAGFPFVLYFAARKNLSVEELPYDRPLRLGFDLPTLQSYAGEYVHHLALSFNWSGRILLVFALAVIPVLLFSPNFRSRTPLACLAAAGAMLILLFALDQESLWGAGEFRFVLYSMPLLAAGIIAIGHQWSPRLVALIGLAALALQLPGAIVAVQRSSGPSSARNFVENYNTPVVFPINSLLKEARGNGWLATDAPVIANEAAYGTVPGVEVSFGPTGEMYCECNAEHPNVMALFVRYTNLNAGALQHPRTFFAPYPSLDALWRKQIEARPVCVARMRQSCGHVLERVEAGETVAVLGTR